MVLHAEGSRSSRMAASLQVMSFQFYELAIVREQNPIAADLIL